MPFIFSEKPFQLSVCLRMLYSCQYWLDTVFFQMIFEFAAPTTVIVNSVGSKLAPMIHYQLPQWTEPPIPFNYLIDYKLAVLSIDLKELPSGQNHPGCVVQDHADLDTGSIPFMPVDMACGKAMLSLIANPLPALLLLFIILGRSLMLQVHVYAIMRYADLILLPDDHLQHPRTEAIAGMGFLDYF